MLCELCQVGALLFILLLCPEQNFWDLPRKKRRVGKYHTLKWDFCLKIRSCSLWSQPFADTSSAVSYNPTGVLGELVGNTRDYRGGVCSNPSLTALTPSSSLYLNFIEEFSI